VFPLMAQRRPVWIPVVTGILRKSDKVLVGRRPEGHTLAGQWEFPGGKLEVGESPEEALKRELYEELSIEADVGNILLTSAHNYTEVSILLIFFEVLFWKGEPKTAHHSDLRWVTCKELMELDIPEANRRILPRLTQILK
jgi:8-oxo-dGTP diphosphatase